MKNVLRRSLTIEQAGTYLERERGHRLVPDLDVNALFTEQAHGLTSKHRQDLEAVRLDELELIQQVERERLRDEHTFVGLHGGAQVDHGRLARHGDRLDGSPASALGLHLLRRLPRDLQAKRHAPIGNVVNDALERE
jgi:hypothetical protein